MSNRFSRSALLIIDVQNDFCPEHIRMDGTQSPQGALAVPEGHKVIPPLNELARSFAQEGGIVVATQDWHPPEHCSFSSIIPQEGQQVGIWPDHCVQGTEGAALHPDLDTRPIHCIIRKGFRPHMDSYSAFFENDHKTPTGLDGLLKTLGIQRVFIGGLATDYCVYYSALDAQRLGYSTTVLLDAVQGVNTPPGSIEDALQQMKANGIQFITTRRLL
jgi:nicotinamidase/pyrazinamidase